MPTKKVPTNAVKINDKIIKLIKPIFFLRLTGSFPSFINCWFNYSFSNLSSCSPLINIIKVRIKVIDRIICSIVIDNK